MCKNNFMIMKRFFSIFIALIALSITPSWAQFTVEDQTKTKEEDVKFKKDFKNIDVQAADFYSDAKAKLERQRIRKERNTLEITVSLQGTMASYNNAWLDTRGGDNSIAVTGDFFLKHTYAKNKFRLFTQAQAKYGYNRIRVENEEGTKEGIWFKNLDQFWIQTEPSRTINNAWSYAGRVKITSQFSKTYGSRTAQTDDNVKTSFMAPGYINLSLGFKYTSQNKKFPIRISLNPLASDGTVAYNDLVEKIYRDKKATNWFGIDMGKHATFSGGSDINIGFDRTWGKNGWFRYWTDCTVYYGWITNVINGTKIRNYYDYLNAQRQWEEGGQVGEAPTKVARVVELHPTVDWKNRFTIKASKFVTTTIEVNLYYNKAQSDEVLIQSNLKVGLTYTFKNK